MTKQIIRVLPVFTHDHDATIDWPRGATLLRVDWTFGGANLVALCYEHGDTVKRTFRYVVVGKSFETSYVDPADPYNTKELKYVGGDVGAMYHLFEVVDRSNCWP